MSMHPDLEWLAAYVSKWPEGFGSCDVVVDDTVQPYGRHVEYKKEGGQWSFLDWQLAREAWLESAMTPESDMHPDLKWLAENVSEWSPSNSFCDSSGASLIRKTGPETWMHCSPNSLAAKDPEEDCFTKTQWLQARQDLGLVMSDAEEQDYAPEEPKRSKYHREIKPGVWVDVYDVLHAWAVQNPALQHLIKKALQPGQRGHKTREQDMAEIVASALRAEELEG